jgi:FkbM family methyltransferase
MSRVVSSASALNRYLTLVPSLLRAVSSETTALAGLTLRIPGPVSIRLSVVAGNARLFAALDTVLRPGSTVIDVGANIGVVAAYAAMRVGSAGRVVAIEPAADNLRVLEENIRRNHLTNVTIVEGAGGRRRESRPFYLRGDVSAVNSLFPESCYAKVTATTEVSVAPIDELVEGGAALVKIDVEGAELDVLAGMPRLLAERSIHLVVEWHPVLQQAAGYAPDALPRMLLAGGFRIDAIGHFGSWQLQAHDIPELASRLRRAGRPVELFARY